MGQKNRKPAFIENSSGGTAKDGFAHAGMPISSHHQEVGSLVCRFIDELLTDRPGLQTDVLAFGQHAVTLQPYADVIERGLQRRAFAAR